MATTKVGLFHDPRKKHPWVVRWFGEYDPATDKEKRYSKSFRLKREAESFKAEKQAEFDKGGQRDRPADITLKAFCGRYMEQRRHEWREKTRLHLDDLSNRLINHFGANELLRRITPIRATTFWSKARMLRKGSEGQELSRYSRNRILRDCKTMFKYAVQWGDLAANPFADIRLMRVGKRNRRNWHYIQPFECMALLKVAPTLRWKVFYALAYTSAARFGELFNLTDRDIDFQNGRLLIRSREGSAELPEFHVKDHEDREIPIPPYALKLVAGWLKARPSGSPFILLTPDRYKSVLARWRQYRASGKPWLNEYMVNNVVRDIRSHAKRAGLQLDGALTMHCFRKSCGQNWADHLLMNVLKELMGHADISTTAEFYSTVTQDHQDRAQWISEALMKGVSPDKSDARMTPGAKTSQDRKAG